ncbi:MAG: radical SAM protein [Candidatus Omnitrophica bacterium]|nr:radical SAM protein [Candidatus Omnitrophota bacterium]
MPDASKKRYRLRVIIPAFPAFNIYSHVARGTTALGPVCVATAVHEMERWDVEVIDENNLRRHGPVSDEGGADHEFLQRLRPADVVGFYGGLTSTIPRLYKLARFYKNKGVVTIAGGQHFVEETIPEALSGGIDHVVIGEGEEAIKELLWAIEYKKDVSQIKGLAYLKDGTPFYTPPREMQVDFDRLPIPDFSLVRYANMSLYPVARIRGCGMDCEFCTVKGKPRYATPERLLEQISYLVETRDATYFFIVDDLFGQQREETIRFCNMLRDYQKAVRKRLGLAVQIRLDKAGDTELLTAMRQASIDMVAIGYESPIEEELKAMNKHIRPEQMLDLTGKFHKAGFLIHGMFIFGYPMPEGINFRMSAEERVKRFRTFIGKAKLDTIQVLMPGPLSGTELRNRLNKQNRVYPVEEVGWEYYDGNFPLFEPDAPMTAEEMQASVKKIMGRFYRFQYLFMLILSVFSFPAMIFFLHNIKLGWRRWYRQWRNRMARFGGWAIMRGWSSAFKKDDYLKKLQRAKQRLSKTGAD